MTAPALAAVVLAAGKGTRMRSETPKVLHKIAGRSMIGHVLDAVEALRPERVVVVVGPGMEEVAKAAAPHAVAVQEHQSGTADALRAALPALEDFTGDVLVLYADTPLIRSETLRLMVEARRSAARPAVVALGMRPADPGAYGRLVVGASGELEKIVEYLDASPDERAIGLCNAGLMAFDGARIRDIVGRIGCENAKGEYYLTDAIEIAGRLGHSRLAVEAPEEDVMGVNCRAELADAERVIHNRLRRAAMDAGVTMIDPDSVFLQADTKFGRDVTIGPSVVFGAGVVVGDRVEIKAFCHIEKATIETGATIGPFARLRPGAEIGASAHIGNFVEIKNARVEAGAKVNHLSYIGDATIGTRANIGAGTITCNYDGYNKHHTEIGADAFIGSNTALVAPVKVGAGAIVGAGSVITQNVDGDSLAVARGRQVVIAGRAPDIRALAAAAKAAKKQD